MSEVAEWVGAGYAERPQEKDKELYKTLHKWANSHADSHDKISVLETNFLKYPEQQQSVAVSRERKIAQVLPDSVVKLIKKMFLAHSVGKQAMRNFDVAFKVNNTGQEIRDTLDDGQNIVLLTGHAQHLFDLPQAHLSACIAANRHRGGIFLNKAMAWEKYGDMTMTSILRYVGDIYWVIPDTESAVKHEIPSEDAGKINRLALEQFLADKNAAKLNNQGRLVSIVPSGTSMIRKYSETEELHLEKLIMPRTMEATKGLISRADAVLPVAVYGDSMLVGDLVHFGEMKKLRRREVVCQQIGNLATMTSELANVPCEVME